MKKSLFLLAWMTITVVGSVYGQFRERANLSLFGGGYAAQENANNRGYWYGMYVDYMPIKTNSNWMFGFAALADRVYFQSNDVLNKYEGSSDEIGGGLAAGKWSEFLTQRYSGYFGANILLKSIRDNGTGYSVQPNGEIGTYTMQQEDLMLAIGLNINLLKAFGVRENLLPRSQLELNWQKPLKSAKSSFWNNTPIEESMIWNKASYSAQFRQSIVQIGRLNTLLEPKLVFGYQYYLGDKSQWLSIGPELALKKRGWDDFFSVFFFVKEQVGTFEPNLNSRQYVVGFTLKPFNVKKN